MTCARARGLFGACWDDDITQGEREWLESHLASCDDCRSRYDAMARSLEAVATLPREEPAPDFTERVMARVRRASPAADHLPRAERRWVPVTAAAAAAVLVLTLVAPWTEWIPGGGVPDRVAQQPVPEFDPVQEAVPIGRSAGATVPYDPAATAEVDPGFVALATDSLFDHSEDVEFVLDPVALRRGRAHPLPAPNGMDGVQVERAVISF